MARGSVDTASFRVPDYHLPDSPMFVIHVTPAMYMHFSPELDARI